jgi:iron complex outermembrane receptor protein
VDGNYELKVDPTYKSLSFTFTGYEAKTIEINETTQIVDVELKGGGMIDQPVVVCGPSLRTNYFTHNPMSSTPTVVEKDFNHGNLHDAWGLVQGKMAGLAIVSSNNPTQTATVRLRGLNSFVGKQTPLIVVNGILDVPIESIDIRDIDKISVLRDAASTVLWGARAAGGVVEIQTKRRIFSDKKIGVGYQVQSSIDVASRRQPVMTADAFRKINNTLNPNFFPNDGISTDWQAEIMRKTAFSHQHQLTFSGYLPTQSLQYDVLLNYRNADGILRNNGYEQLGGRVALSQRIGKLDWQADFSTLRRNVDYGIEEAFRYAATALPITAVKSSVTPNTYGGYNEQRGFDIFNPVAMIEQNRQTGRNNYWQGRLQAKYEISNDLKLVSTYAHTDADVWRREGYATQAKFRGFDLQGFVQHNQNQTTSDFSRTYLEWTKNDLHVFAGYDYERSQNQSYWSSANGFSTDENVFQAMTDTSLQRNGRSRNLYDTTVTQKSSGVFGRLYYDLMGYANLIGMVKWEKNSQYTGGGGNAWFWSIGGNVLLNKWISSTKLDHWSLRMNYGNVGGLPMPSLARAGVNDRLALVSERKKEFNLGTHLQFANGKLDVQMDYFVRRFTNLLYPFDRVPAGFGVPPNGILWANGGDMTTKGWDISVDWRVVQKQKFSWKTGLILNTNKTKLNSIEASSLNGFVNGISDVGYTGSPGFGGVTLNRLAYGSNIGQIFGYEDAGLDNNNIMLIRKADGNTARINTGTDADKKLLGSAIPKYTLGWSNGLTWGKWDMSLLVRGVFGHSLVNQMRMFYENGEPSSALSYNRIDTKYADTNLKLGGFTSRFVEKADFVRIENLELGYDLTKPSQKISKLRVYAVVNNLLTLTKYTGISPEPQLEDRGSPSNGGYNFSQPLVMGIDRRGGYLPSRSFSVGVEVRF